MIRAIRVPPLSWARTLVAVPDRESDTTASGLRQMPPLDLPMVPFVLAGLAVWALLGLTLLVFRTELIEAGRGIWLWICLDGFLAGLPGLALMVVHDANRRRRRAATR